MLNLMSTTTITTLDGGKHEYVRDWKTNGVMYCFPVNSNSLSCIQLTIFEFNRRPCERLTNCFVQPHDWFVGRILTALVEIVSHESKIVINGMLHAIG
jgi:hypothetical protein